MKLLLKFEEAALLLLSIYLFGQTSYAWWWYPLLLLLPDLSMLGYLGGPHTGAFTYNLIHHRALAIATLLFGWFLQLEPIILSGTILLGHISIDRIAGYGLKHADSFHHTHLGWIKSSKS
ncbi:MAG: DUF4260 domain-containing protein [Cyclobacteriaceae bacterium]|nr:DUF4260 domain-containing protein [Cyclobacteriaceae bacterium]